ncbi:MAG TPA: hypothetical protein VL307_09285 [Chitinophagaceae bacterium]|nr:hypothetical protein [Chitinophagaceae bacterium]
MKTIGGYFELELQRGSAQYHETAFLFQSGRSSLHYLLQWLRPARVYLPYYTCDGLLESFYAAGTDFLFYEINEQLEPLELPVLGKGEYFLYINYFDLKRKYVASLSAMYADRLIVDCTQAFFMKGNGKSWFFNSCRKFFGVPDGSFLYAPDNSTCSPITGHNESYSVAHLLQRFNGHAEEGYPSFIENESLCGTDIKGMSLLCQALLSHVDYEAVMAMRRRNYQFIDALLGKSCLLPSTLVDDCVPMFYPLMPAVSIERKRLYNHQLYIPRFWEDVTRRGIQGYHCSEKIATTLLPLPVDHRYNLNDMQRIIAILKYDHE